MDADTLLTIDVERFRAFLGQGTIEPDLVRVYRPELVGDKWRGIKMWAGVRHVPGHGYIADPNALVLDCYQWAWRCSYGMTEGPMIDPQFMPKWYVGDGKIWRVDIQFGGVLIAKMINKTTHWEIE